VEGPGQDVGTSTQADEGTPGVRVRDAAKGFTGSMSARRHLK